MHFTTFISLALALASSTLVTSAPVADPAPAELSKRAIEVVYLTRCLVGSSQSGFTQYQQEMAYYSDINASQAGQVPSYNNRAVFNTVPYGGAPPLYVGTKSGLFPTGVTFRSVIAADGYQKFVGVAAGTGDNGYHSNWVCKRDSTRLLYEIPGSRYCQAEFYCQH
ncbi:hypothetical protein BJ508DRAFT_302970 [Ascobolus immersus RN42]|uniref:Uncharacterized protein n=1 Tax=Ascobolus immersus RN42 TaxID=1160509 RepID=A0A3N4IHI8_ASCIM|nr:hypothetical protein BJ508DRAFT_302970 [Ascobolus immersus RN42]